MNDALLKREENARRHSSTTSRIWTIHRLSTPILHCAVYLSDARTETLTIHVLLSEVKVPMLTARLSFVVRLTCRVLHQFSTMSFLILSPVGRAIWKELVCLCPVTRTSSAHRNNSLSARLFLTTGNLCKVSRLDFRRHNILPSLQSLPMGPIGEFFSLKSPYFRCCMRFRHRRWDEVIVVDACSIVILRKSAKRMAFSECFVSRTTWRRYLCHIIVDIPSTVGMAIWKEFVCVCVFVAGQRLKFKQTLGDGLSSPSQKTHSKRWFVRGEWGRGPGGIGSKVKKTSKITFAWKFVLNDCQACWARMRAWVRCRVHRGSSC